MRLPDYFAFFLVAASASVSATAQTHYEPLASSSDWTLESTDGGPALQEAIDGTDWPDSAPLMEGWVSRWVYMRLFDDRQVFFVLVDEDAAEEKYICRVAFDSFPPADSNRDADAALARLGALCERKKYEPVGAASMRLISPGQPGGPKLGEQMEYSIADGTRLQIRHIENSGIWLPALPPEIDREPLVIGSMPAPRDRRSGRHERFWYVRDESGQWGLSVHFGHGQDLGRSGCFIRSLTDPAKPPSATWLTDTSLDWCRARQQAYVEQQPDASVPKNRVYAPAAPRPLSDE